MGQGFALVLEESEADVAVEMLRKGGEARVMGQVTEGKGVHLPGSDLTL